MGWNLRADGTPRAEDPPPSPLPEGEGILPFMTFPLEGEVTLSIPFPRRRGSRSLLSPGGRGLELAPDVIRGRGGGKKASADCRQSERSRCCLDSCFHRNDEGERECRRRNVIRA